MYKIAIKVKKPRGGNKVRVCIYVERREEIVTNEEGHCCAVMSSTALHSEGREGENIFTTTVEIITFKHITIISLPKFWSILTVRFP